MNRIAALLAMVATVVGATAAAACDAGEGEVRVKAAQAFRAAAGPVAPAPDVNIIVLENWTGKEIKGMTLTASIPVPAKAELASGAKVETKKDGDKTVFTCDIDVAVDVLILR